MMANTRRQSILWILLGVVVIGFLLLSLMRFFSNPNHWVQQVVVTGVSADKQAQFKQVLKPYLNASLVDINLSRIERACMQFAWVSAVTVRKVWPNTLKLSVKTQQLIANWNNAFALNVFGERFALKSMLTGVPTFKGPLGSEVQVYAMYQQFSQILDPWGLNITFLQLEVGDSWLIRLNNGMQIQLGAKQILTRLSRFVKVYPKVFKTPASAMGRHVDLRYTYGMAVDKGETHGKKKTR